MAMKKNRIRKQISKGASEDELTETAKTQGMKTLHEDGLSKVAKGITTLEEIMRVCDKTGE